MATPEDYDRLKAVLDGWQNRPRRQAPQGGGNLQAQIAAAKRAMGPQEKPDTDWDKFWRPAGHIINALTAGGYGATGALDKIATRAGESAARARADGKLDLNEVLGMVGDTFRIPGDFLGSAGDAITNNEKALRTGSDVIENFTDQFGKAGNRNYKDVEDNADPLAKGIGGFVMDVGLDPLTYLPGGMIVSGIKGANKAAKAAAIATDGSDAAKTIAMGKEALRPSNYMAGARDWSTQRAADKIARKQFKQARADVKAGRLSPEDFVSAQVARPGVAARGTKGSPGETAARQDDVIEQTLAEVGERVAPKFLDDVDEAINPNLIEEAAAKVADDVAAGTPDAATITERQNARILPAAQAVNAQTPVTRDKVSEFLNGLTYTNPKWSKTQEKAMTSLSVRPGAAGVPKGKEYDALRDIKVYRAKVAAKQKAWDERVIGLFGKDFHAKAVKATTKDELRALAQQNVGQVNAQKFAKNATSTAMTRALFTKKNTFDEEQLKDLARLLGFTGRHFGPAKNMVEFFKKKDLPGLLRKADLEQRRRTKMFAQEGILYGDDIEAAAANLTPELARGEGVTQLAAVVRESDPELIAAAEVAWKDAARGIYGTAKEYPHRQVDSQGDTILSASEKLGPGVKVIKERVWESRKTMTFGTTMLKTASEIARRRGLSGAAREDFMDAFTVRGFEFLDARLRSLGITPLVGKTRDEKSLFRVGEKANQLGKAEDAFLGFSDVLKALPPDLRKALLATGKDMSLPMTVLHDMARWTVRLAKEGGLEEGEKLGAVIQAATATLRKQAAGGAKYDSLEFALGPRGQASIQAAAGALWDARGSLVQAHIRNGAMARAVVGSISREMTEDIAQRLITHFRGNGFTAGDDVNVILKAYDDLANAIRREGASEADLAIAARYDIDLLLSNAMDIGTIKKVRADVRMKYATQMRADGKLMDEADLATARSKVKGGAALKADGSLSKPASVKKSDAAKGREKAAKAAANTARTQEVRDIAPEIDQVLQNMEDAGMFAADEAANISLMAARAALSQGLPNWLKKAHKLGQKMDGGFGMRDLKHHEISTAISTRKATAQFREALNGLTKKFGAEDLQGAWNALKALPTNELTDDLLAGLTPATQAAAKGLWPLMSQVFDHSGYSLIARMGLDGDYLNTFLVRVGIQPEYLLNKNANGWEAADIWKTWEFQEQNPIEVLDGYYNAIQQASVAPTLAASFSAEFGNRSTAFGRAISDADAAKDPQWAKISAKPDKGVKSGGLAQFIDPEQYYPKEMIAQLSMLDEYLGTSRLLDEGKIFDNVFRQVDPIVNAIKASITLWRPGHHVTNIMGETLFNALAGVANPARYVDGFRVLASRGYVDMEGANAMSRFLTDNAPDGFQLKAANAGQGVTAIIGGKAVTWTYDSAFKFFDDAGIVIHHNVAEDLINENIEAAGRRAFAQPLQDAVTPRWLGNVAAQRDNLFRLTHAVDILSKRSFRSLEEAKAAIAKEVHSYHPTMQTLSAFEQKYMRRWMYFYTWQRQAISRVFESLIDTPGRVTAASKFIYNASEVNGAEPQSFGQPMPNDPRIPTFAQGNITSVVAPGDLQGGGSNPDSNFLWTASMNAPQLDILQVVFGDARVNPDKDLFGRGQDSAQQALETVLGAATPAVRVPFELATQSRVGGGRITNPNEYLIDQTGLRTASILFGDRADTPDSPMLAQARKDTALLNFLSGMRVSNATSPNNADRAQRDRDAELRRLAEMMMKESQGQ